MTDNHKVAEAVWLARQYYFTLFCEAFNRALPSDATPRQTQAALHSALTFTQNQIDLAKPEQPDALPIQPPI